MIKITSTLYLDPSEIQYSFIRSPGPGGQNVNKVATAVQLRFTILNSPSLPLDVQERLFTQLGNKITESGEIIIKASRYRSQLKNKTDALERLIALLQKAAFPPKKRKPTKPTKASKRRRQTQKKNLAQKKHLRKKPAQDKE